MRTHPLTPAFHALTHGGPSKHGAASEGTVLLLHGFPDVPRTFAPVMRRLADAGYRTVAPWMRGYAPSTLEGPFHLDQLAADALAMADALGEDGPIHLVGHDWGAVTGYAAVQAAPDRFATLTAISVPHPLAFVRALATHPAQLRRSAYMAFFQLPRLPERALRRGLIERLWRAWSPGFEPPAEHLAEVVATVTRSLPAPLGYYRAMTRPLGEAAARIRRAQMERVRVPTLYLHGVDDGCIGPEIATGQQRWLEARLTSERIESAGHFAPLEQPDTVADAILRHVRSRRREARHEA